MPGLYKSLFDYFSILRRLEDNLSWELFLIMGLLHGRRGRTWQQGCLGPGVSGFAGWLRFVQR